VLHVPAEAQIFPAIVGVGFLVFGLVFFLRSDAMARRGRTVFEKAESSSPNQAFPKAGQVRAYGTIFMAIGVSLVGFSLWMLLS
jgi:hypothetical protein